MSTKMTPEGLVKSRLTKILKEHGVTYMYVPQGAYSNTAIGYPDVCAYTPDGRHFVVEVKSASGHLGPKQIKWKEKLIQLNVPYFLYRGNDAEELKLLDFLAFRNQ